MAEEQKKKSNQPAYFNRPDKGGKHVLRIVQPGDPAPVPRRGVYRGAPKSTPLLEPTVEPTQTELKYLWATMSPTEDLDVIKQAVDKLVKDGKIRADAAPVVLSYAVYAQDEILGRERGESRKNIQKFINQNYFFDFGSRAAKDLDEEEIVDFVRAGENTKEKFIGAQRSALPDETFDEIKKSLNDKSGRAFVNATLDKAVESGSEPDDSARRAEKIERILRTKPPEKPIKVSEGPLKRRPRQRSRIVVGPEGDDKETALKVGDKAFTR
jgi:hypothetical protein